MTDKLRKTAPIKITFAASEQPSSEKLTGLAQQTRAALKIVEKAIGDIWNQSGDSLLADYPAQIPNLSRLIGESKYLNPAIYPLQNIFKYRDKLGTRYQGWTYGELTFKPLVGSTLSFYNTSGQFTTSKSNEYEVIATGDYWISTATGKWRTNDELVGGSEQVEYQVDPSTDYLADAQVYPSIIPDPRHLSAKFSGCRLTKSGSTYYLYLPPRRPLAFTGTDWQDALARPDKYPDANDIGLANGNEATTLDAGNLRYWQSDTVDAMDHAHYRYSLPKEIVDNHGGMAAGAEYPSNLMYLWDQATNTILEGVVFRKPFSVGLASKTWVIEVSSASASLDLEDYLSSPDDETEAAYSSTGLTLITCSGSVIRNLWKLITNFLTHKHNNAALDSKIDHSSLTHLNPAKDSIYTSNGRYPSYIPAWPQSRYQHDDHTYLLSRTGSQSIASGDHRDENDNAMLGDLIMANSVADANGVFLDSHCPDNSFAIYFGDLAGSLIYGREDNLRLESVSGSVELTGPYIDGNANTINLIATNDIYLSAVSGIELVTPEIVIPDTVFLSNAEEGPVLEVCDNGADRTNYSYQPIVVGLHSGDTPLQDTIEDIEVTVTPFNTGSPIGSTPTAIWVCIVVFDLALRRFRRIATEAAILTGGNTAYNIQVAIYTLPYWAYGYRIYACTTSDCDTSSPYWEYLRSNYDTVYYGDYPGGTTPTGTGVPVSLSARDPGYVFLADGTNLETEPSTVLGPLHIYTDQVDPSTTVGAQIQIFAPEPSIFLRYVMSRQIAGGNSYDIKFYIDDSSLYLHNLSINLDTNDVEILGGLTSRQYLQTQYYGNNATGPAVNLIKGRGTYNPGEAAVQDEDTLGEIHFKGYYGGNVTFAKIQGAVDIAPGSGSYPGRLSFFTTPNGSGTPTERVRIESNGDVRIGTSADANLYLRGNNHIFEYNSDTPSAQPTLQFKRSDGTYTSRTSIQPGDHIGRLDFYGYYSSPNTWVNVAYIGVKVPSVGGIGSTDMPGEINFATTLDGTASPQVRLKILHGGNIVFPSLGTLPENADGSIVNYNGGTTGSLKYNDGTAWYDIVRGRSDTQKIYTGIASNFVNDLSASKVAYFDASYGVIVCPSGAGQPRFIVPLHLPSLGVIDYINVKARSTLGVAGEVVYVYLRKKEFSDAPASGPTTIYTFSITFTGGEAAQDRTLAVGTTDHTIIDDAFYYLEFSTSSAATMTWWFSTIEVGVKQYTPQLWNF